MCTLKCVCVYVWVYTEYDKCKTAYVAQPIPK